MPPTANVSISRRLAYALFEPAAASPGLLMRRAFEEIGGNPHIGLAASDYGALMVLFASEQERAAAMSRFPLPFEGHTIRLERPEEGGNRFFWRFERLALVTATGFPVEHWDEGGIRNAFRSIGSVCCIDPLCLAEIDFSAVRLVLKLAEGGEVPNTLIMHDCHGQSSAEVHLRVVQCWPFEEDLSTRPFSHFDDLAGGGRRGDGARTTRMDDIDEDSVHGSPPAERGRGKNSSVASLWRRIVERRQASIARAAALEDIDDVPPAFELGHFSPAAQSTPVAIWDRILARRLADQFPESGLDADQVNPVPLSLLITSLKPVKPCLILPCSSSSGMTPWPSRPRLWTTSSSTTGMELPPCLLLARRLLHATRRPFFPMAMMTMKMRRASKGFAPSARPTRCSKPAVALGWLPKSLPCSPTCCPKPKP
jgi:hypothetical protein